MRSVEEYFSSFDVYKNYTKSFRDQVEKHVGQLTSDKALQLPKLEGYLAYLEKGNRLMLEDVYFKRRREAVSLALYLQWKHDEEKFRFFEEMLFSICQEYSWALPAHIQISEEHTGYVDGYETVDLFASETAHFLAECTVLFKNQLNPALLSIIKTEIQKRVLTPFFNKEWKFERLENNWSAVCAGAIGIAALIIEKNQEHRDQILHRVERALQCFLQGYGEDGACVEGMGYWIYGVGYFSYFADLYEKVEGIDLFKDPKWKNIVTFPLKAIMPTGKFIPFSDSPDNVTFSSGLNAFFFEKFSIVPAKECGVTNFHFDHCYRWGHLSRILWWSSKKSKVSYQDFDGEFIFNNANWVIVKRPNVFFAVKGGNNDESHNHNDLGHFILGDDKGLIFDDLGAGVYTADYFGEKRYEHIHTRSYWHSVPYINKQEQMNGPGYQAVLSDICRGSDGFCVMVNLQDAYPNTKNIHFTRSYSLSLEERILRIKDVFSQPIQYETHFVTRVKPEIYPEYISWNNGKWNMYFDRERYKVELEESIIKNHSDEQETIYNLIFISQKEDIQEFEFQITWLDGEKDE